MLKGAPKFGTKAEVKNVNSFRFIRAALEYEIERQIEVIEEGGRVVQETRLWNAHEGRTYSMRSKEQAHDYRYFPEPDLPPLVVTPEWLARCEGKASRTARGAPHAHDRRVRIEHTGCAHADRIARICRPLRSSREEGEKPAARCQPAAERDLGGRLKALGLELEQSPVSMAGIVLAADLLERARSVRKQMKQLFDVGFEKGEDFPAVYEREKPQQITDPRRLKR